MSKIIKAADHLAVILGIMFLVFLILDQFNPMMDFTDNSVSRWLLAVLCLGGIVRSVLGWRREDREQKTGKQQAD